MTENNNEQKQYKYDAFISYRHGGVDEFVAKELHKMLEGYRLPAGVKSPTGKKVIKKVFKDTEELPLASNLSDPIVEAIKESEHLIVVCSPRLRESEWCKTELKTFIEYHGRENVYCVIAEGEPSEVFPFALTMREDGTPIEPLAADFRGEDNKAIKAKMKSELLRLIAPMFKLGYDDIKRREREQKIKTLVRSSIMITAAAVILGVYFAFTSYRLKAQNEKIEEQSLEISSQANEILEQNEQLKLDRARDLSEQSLRYIEDDLIGDALDSAYQAAVYNEDALPYTAGTQYALSKCLRLYENGYYYVATNQIAMPAAVNCVIASPDEKYVLLGDKVGDVILYNVVNHSIAYTSYCKVGNIDAVASDTIKKYAGFIDENTIYYVDMENQLVIYDYASKTEIACIPFEYVSCVVCSEDKSRIAVADINGITVYSTDNFERAISNYSECMSAYKIYFSSDSNYIIYDDAHGAYTDDACVIIHAIDVITGEETSSTTIEGVDDVETILENDGYCYVAATKSTFDSSTITYIYKLDYVNSQVLWETDCQGRYYYNIVANDAGYIFVYGGYAGVVIDEQSGQAGNVIIIGENIVSDITVVDGVWTGFTENGYWMILDPKNTDCYSYASVECVQLNSAQLVNGIVIGAPKASDRIIIYSRAFCPDAKEYNGEVPDSNDDERAVRCDEYTNIEGEYDVPNPRFVYSYYAAEDDNLLLVSYDDYTLSVYALDTMDELGETKLENVMTHYYGKDVYGNIYVGGMFNASYAINESIEPVAAIKSFVGLTNNGKEIIVQNCAPNAEHDYYTIPIYTYDELVEMAEKRLGL